MFALFFLGHTYALEVLSNYYSVKTVGLHIVLKSCAEIKVRFFIMLAMSSIFWWMLSNVLAFTLDTLYSEEVSLSE